MVAAVKQPELYPLEAWALARCIKGVQVDPDIAVRPQIWSILDQLFHLKPELRASQLRGYVSQDAFEQVLGVDVQAPAPNGRGKTPPAKLLKEAVDNREDEGEDTGSRVKPTDDELGDQLIERWGGQYAYIYGNWHRYENGVWLPDKRNQLQFWQILIDNKAKGIKPNSGKASSVEAYCQLRLLVDETNVDQTQNYINLKNGLYDLEAGALVPHRPDLYLTSQLDFKYDPRATCPNWMKFLNQVLVTPDGNPDGELITVMQEAFGYSLTAYTHLRTSFWLVGPSGSGKSTLLKVLINMSGSGHIAIDLDAMKDNQYQLADVAGKRLVTFTEPDARSPLADGQYKRLVSSDTVSARQIHGKPFNFVPQCKLWGAMNDTPRVVDRSDAVYGRIIIIPMLHVFPKSEWDLTIDDKLKAELPGIFNWSLEGWKRLQQTGQFTRARQSEQAREDYRAENDAEASYVEERLERGGQLSLRADELYRDYKNWCEENGFKPKNRNTVAKDWRRLGMVSHHTKKGNFYQGVQIREQSREIAF